VQFFGVIIRSLLLELDFSSAAAVITDQSLDSTGSCRQQSAVAAAVHCQTKSSCITALRPDRRLFLQNQLDLRELRGQRCVKLGLLLSHMPSV